MVVLHIYGASGAGTSTLGRALGEALGCEWLDTDDFFWLPTDPPFREKRPEAQRIALLEQGIRRAEKAVISGSLCGWGDALIHLFDLAIRLEMPQPVRLRRLEEREYRRFGPRICPGGDMYRQHLDFMAWAAAYDEGGEDMRSRAMHDAWSRKLTCPHLTLDSTAPVAQLVEAVRAACPQV